MMILWVLCVALVLGGLLASLSRLPTWRTLWLRLVRRPVPVKVAKPNSQFLRYGPAARRIPRAGPACYDLDGLRFKSDPSVR
jgi:hypothetical protein